MTQEQKPFEIRNYNQLVEIRRLQLRCDELQLQLEAQTHWRLDAQDEIQRLQEEKSNILKLIEEQRKIWNSDREALKNLKQQLAAAPSWGEWQDAIKSNLENTAAGVHELEAFNGETEIAFAFDAIWYTESGTTSDELVVEENFRFRRLNYEPKPARRVQSISKELEGEL